MPKATDNPLRKRSTSSGLSPLKRQKSTGEKKPVADRLSDIGPVNSLSPSGVRQDVICLIKHIRLTMFGQLPERAGMNSTQISDTLRFRASLPPIVSLTHLYALSDSPTSTERELARLVAQGVIRKVKVPGRGKGGAAVGDGVVLCEDWVGCIEKDSSLSSELKHTYLALLQSHPRDQTVAIAALKDVDVRSLVTAGFLTNPAAISTGMGDLFASPSSSNSLLGISSAGSKAPTGTLAAVGGTGAVHESGGSGSMLATSSTRSADFSRAHSSQAREMTFSLPNTGVYLKLLVSARAHLVHLLKQISPRWREAVLGLLREKWNGGFGNVEVGERKRARGEGNALLPGRTKKWREFMGIEFDFILAEAVGSGIIELFDTGSVGLGVRAR